METRLNPSEVWEVDCCRWGVGSDDRPQWDLFLCDRLNTFQYQAQVSQGNLSSAWVTAQLGQALALAPTLPRELRAFRPQAVNLLQPAAIALALPLCPTPHTPTLKGHRLIQAQAQGIPGDPLAVERPAPVPVPETLWGDQWRFGAIAAADFQTDLAQAPIPIQSLPPHWLPLNAGIASTLPLPGVIIDGGRRSMALAQWLAQQGPVALEPQGGELGGLLLEAGLQERWVLATYGDPQVTAAAATFLARRQATQGLHFLLIRPDDSGITYTGLWLLRSVSLEWG